jgi:hypothetical protein
MSHHNRSYLAIFRDGAKWLLRPEYWNIREGVLARPQWDPMLSPALMAFSWLMGVYTFLFLIFSGFTAPLNYPVGSVSAAFLGWRIFALLIQRVYFPDWRERRESDETLDSAWKN